jgi:uncharacterized membrane protein YhaH (DUF805 family)
MDFVEATKTCLRKYATFEGRASRSEYWWFMLFGVLVGIASSMLSSTLNALVSLALLLPSIAAGARRLHDIGKSGWLQLVWLIPVIGWAIMIWWAVQPSAGPNAWGAGPELPRDDPLGIPPSV